MPCYKGKTLKWVNAAVIHRSSHRRCSIIKGVLRNFSKFTGKRLCQSLFFNKAAKTFFTEHLRTTASGFMSHIKGEYSVGVDWDGEDKVLVHKLHVRIVMKNIYFTWIVTKYGSLVNNILNGGFAPLTNL